jgi:outer membrane lipoprotein SlyB
MDQQSVVAVYESRDDAREAVHILKRAGISHDHISLVAPRQPGDPDSIDELKFGDDSIRDAGVGAGVGGLVGLLSGAIVLAATGGGAAFIVGPLAAGATGAIVGALLGAMEGWGVHRHRLQEYEDAIEQGKILVIVHGDPETVSQAERLLQETQSKEIHMHARTGDDSPEVDDRLGK